MLKLVFHYWSFFIIIFLDRECKWGQGVEVEGEQSKKERES